MKSTYMFRAITLAIAFLIGIGPSGAQNVPPERPRLVLLIAVDQFRYDYLTRFRSEYTGGLKLLLEKGAVFVDANLEHYPTVTAVGHSTMLSGATPALSGIMGNDWYDRETAKQVTSVSDPSVKLLGGAEGAAGSSPHWLMVSTIGDELKRANIKSPKVFGLSLKDRSAILPAGRMADGAFWFNDATGEFVSSTWYYQSLPAWASEFNAAKNADKFAGQTWLAASGRIAARKLADRPSPQLYGGVYSSPFGNDLLEQFAETAIQAERLGQRDTTDLLSVSFSSNDAVGHAFGPDSPEAHEVSLNVDKAIGRLLQFVDQQVGLDKALVMLTADHAVSPSQDVLAEQRMPGGRIKGNFFEPLQKALEIKYGAGLWISSTAGSSPYLNYSLIATRNLDPAEVRRVAATAMLTAPHVLRVYTWDDMATARAAPTDRIDRRVLGSFNSKRSGDLEIIIEPYWIRGGSVATHGTPYNYDTHIPLIFMGKMIRPGRYYQHAALNDLAPTVATLLDIEIPSGSSGRVLGEAIAQPRAEP